MNLEDVVVIKAKYKTCCLLTMSLDKALHKTLNKQFIDELIGQIEAYDIIFKECEMLAKATDINLNFKCNVKDQKILDMFNDGNKETFDVRKLSKIIYLQTVNALPEIIFALTDNTNASQELTELATKLKYNMENNEKTLKELLNTETQILDEML